MILLKQIKAPIYRGDVRVVKTGARSVYVQTSKGRVPLHSLVLPSRYKTVMYVVSIRSKSGVLYDLLVTIEV